jgi:hypothetical protein
LMRSDLKAHFKTFFSWCSASLRILLLPLIPPSKPSENGGLFNYPFPKG